MGLTVVLYQRSSSLGKYRGGYFWTTYRIGGGCRIVTVNLFLIIMVLVNFKYHSDIMNRTDLVQLCKTAS